MANLIAPHGGYKNLKSFQMAEIVFDLTFKFCEKYIPAYKMRDQMEGAARGGSQNIAEGSENSGTSKATELRLVNVARGSLEELLKDYLAFLRQRDIPIWDKNDRRSLEIRQLAYMSNKSYKTYMSYLEAPETAANCLICLINQANYLLDKQLSSLDKDFMAHGDIKDRYKEIKKKQFLGQDQDYDAFLKQFNLKRLENGRVVDLDDPAVK